MRIREVLTTRPVPSRPKGPGVLAMRFDTFRKALRFDRVPHALLAIVAMAAILAIPSFFDRPYYIRVGASIGLAVIVVASLNVITGWTGLLSLGHIGYYAMGAYVYAFLASPHFGIHLPFVLACVAAAATTAIFGILIGSVSLRLRGDYLAMVTLAFAEILRNLLISLDRPVNLTGGVNGILGLDSPSFFQFEITDLPQFYYLIWIVALVVLLALTQLRRTRFGRGWLAIREDEVAAASLGVNIFGYKLLAFTVAAAIAGLAGAVFASWQGSVFPEGYTVEQTAVYFCMLVVGGGAGAVGIVIGAALLIIVPEMLRDSGVYRELLFGILLVVTMRYRPQGLFSFAQRRSTESSVGSTVDVGMTTGVT